MYLITAPDRIETQLALPLSKSISNRALILKALSGNRTQIAQLADCDDSCVLQSALASSAEQKELGAAGTAMRFLTAYYALQENQSVVLTGSARMKQRPIGLLVDALNQLGGDIRYLEREGYPPLLVNGKKLEGGSVSIDGSISSQYLSALLMIAPCCRQGLQLTIEGKLNSRPYLEMTLSMMRQFGADFQWNDQQISVQPTPYAPPVSFEVEADWSAASYWYEMVALMSHYGRSASVCLMGLQSQSSQGDAQVAQWFSQLGVDSQWHNGDLLLQASGAPIPSRFEADFSQQPDLAQTFAVTLALMDLPFCLHGLESLRIKETDRMQALLNEMRRLGYVLEVDGNSLQWRGQRCNPEADCCIATYEDHRMAMSFAPAAIAAESIGLRLFAVEHPEVVAKSYPSYWDDLSRAGFCLKNA